MSQNIGEQSAKRPRTDATTAPGAPAPEGEKTRTGGVRGRPISAPRINLAAASDPLLSGLARRITTEEAARAAELAKAAAMQKADLSWVRHTVERARPHAPRAPRRLRAADDSEQAALSRYVATVARSVGTDGRPLTPPPPLPPAPASDSGSEFDAAATASVEGEGTTATTTTTTTTPEAAPAVPLVIAPTLSRRRGAPSTVAATAAVVAASRNTVPTRDADAAARTEPALLALGSAPPPAPRAVAAMALAVGTKFGAGFAAAAAAAAAASDTAPPLPPVAWFAPGRIAPEERRGLCGVLSADGGPGGVLDDATYVAARDAMVRLSAANPGARLTATLCRRHLRVDAAALLLVHRFLEENALINRAPGRAPSAATAAVRPLYADAAPACAATPPATAEKEQKRRELVTQLYQRVLAQSCGLAGCRPAPAGTAGGEAPEWTPEEHARLLEALAADPTDWARVQRAVGGAHSREDCVAHFAALPIEDPYLEDQLSLASAALQRAAAAHTSVAALAARDRARAAREARTLGVVRVLAAYAARPHAAAALHAARTALCAQPGGVCALRDEAARTARDDAAHADAVLADAHAAIARLEHKLASLTEYERFVEDEWAQLERARKQLLRDRLAVSSAAPPPPPSS